jgi:hypothetical protein
LYGRSSRLVKLRIATACPEFSGRACNPLPNRDLICQPRGCCETPPSKPARAPTKAPDAPSRSACPSSARALPSFFNRLQPRLEQFGQVKPSPGLCKARCGLPQNRSGRRKMRESAAPSLFARFPLGCNPGWGAPAASRELERRKVRSEGDFRKRLLIFQQPKLVRSALVCSGLAPAISVAPAAPERPGFGSPARGSRAVAGRLGGVRAGRQQVYSFLAGDPDDAQLVLLALVLLGGVTEHFDGKGRLKGP